MIDVVTLSRTPYLFERAAVSVDAQGEEYRGFAVDNTPDDGLEPITAALGWTRLPWAEGLTFSKGNNAAARLGEADRILFLNDDAQLEPGCVETMLTHDDDVVGCLILNSAGNVNHAGVELKAFSLMVAHFAHMGRDTSPIIWENEDENTASVTFAVALVKRNMWEKLGGLDEGFEWGFEDTDFSLRVHQTGGTVLTCRAARAIHDEFGTRSGLEDIRNGTRLAGKWLSTGRLWDVLPPQTPPRPHLREDLL